MQCFSLLSACYYYWFGEMDNEMPSIYISKGTFIILRQYSYPWISVGSEIDEYMLFFPSGTKKKKKRNGSLVWSNMCVWWLVVKWNERRRRRAVWSLTYSLTFFHFTKNICTYFLNNGSCIKACAALKFTLDAKLYIPYCRHSESGMVMTRREN